MKIDQLPTRREHIEELKRCIRLYLERYTMEELKWHTPDKAECRGILYEFGVSNAPKQYAGFHYCWKRDAKGQDLVLDCDGKFQLYTQANAGRHLFKTKEQVIAVLEKTLGIPASVCRCDLGVLMTQGCRCGAFKREKEKHATRV